MKRRGAHQRGLRNGYTQCCLKKISGYTLYTRVYPEVHHWSPSLIQTVWNVGQGDLKVVLTLVSNVSPAHRWLDGWMDGKVWLS